MDSDSYDDVYAEMDRIMADLRRAGHVPYAIPVGGSVPLGSPGLRQLCPGDREPIPGHGCDL